LKYLKKFIESKYRFAEAKFPPFLFLVQIQR
jgi:hypothetical protein